MNSQFYQTIRNSLFSLYKKTPYFRKWGSEIVEIEAGEVLKIKVFAFVNDYFQYKSNEDIDVFRRTLFTIAFSIILTLLLSIHSFGQISELPFISGEKLQYRVSYNWGLVWVDAGKVEFEVDSSTLNDQPIYHFKSFGRSLTAYDWIYKVRDRFESMADAETFSPIQYWRKTSEGSYKVENQLFFDMSNDLIISKTKNSNRQLKVDTIPYNSEIFDLQTAVYYARSLDYSTMKQGDKIPLMVIIDGKKFDLCGKYYGIELVENHDGTFYRCHRFSTTLIEGTIFSKDEEASIWLTADRNKIPILVEAKILVGYVKAYFVKGFNLKFPIEANSIYDF